MDRFALTPVHHRDRPGFHHALPRGAVLASGGQPLHLGAPRPARRLSRCALARRARTSRPAAVGGTPDPLAASHGVHRLRRGTGPVDRGQRMAFGARVWAQNVGPVRDGSGVSGRAAGISRLLLRPVRRARVRRGRRSLVRAYQETPDAPGLVRGYGLHQATIGPVHGGSVAVGRAVARVGERGRRPMPPGRDLRPVPRRRWRCRVRAHGSVIRALAHRARRDHGRSRCTGALRGLAARRIVGDHHASWRHAHRGGPGHAHRPLSPAATTPRRGDTHRASGAALALRPSIRQCRAPARALRRGVHAAASGRLAGCGPRRRHTDHGDHGECAPLSSPAAWLTPLGRLRLFGRVTRTVLPP